MSTFRCSHGPYWKRLVHLTPSRFPKRHGGAVNVSMNALSHLNLYTNKLRAGSVEHTPNSIHVNGRLLWAAQTAKGCTVQCMQSQWHITSSCHHHCRHAVRPASKQTCPAPPCNINGIVP